jgi:hypothetical protein
MGQKLLEKMIVAQLINKLPVFYGTPGSITVFKRANIQSTPI